MKALLLCAGRGRRLLPLTAETPKCLLPVRDGEPALALQLRALARAGVERALVAVGFRADRVERFLAEHPVPGLAVETLYNPWFGLSDNLATCWLARSAMDEDFALVNGDTVFEARVLERLLAAHPAPVTLAIDRKPSYDADDMKVALDASGRLLRIGKRLPPHAVRGESAGLVLFRGTGPKLFAAALERAVRRPGALSRWYVAALDALAHEVRVETVSLRGLWWLEIDSVDDLARARRRYRRAQGARRPLGGRRS